MAVSGTGFGFPSGTNPYVPTNNVNVTVTADLVIGYGRDVKSFPIMGYTKIIPVKKPQGLFTRIAVGQQARIQYPDLRDFKWSPGQDAPRGNWNQFGFQFFPFFTNRYTYPTTLDQRTVDVASFQLQTLHVSMCAQQAMSGRTQAAVGTYTNPANWYSTHVTDCTAYVGGKWSAGTGTAPTIQPSLYKAAIQIQQDTLGAIRQNQLTVVINPTTARATAQSQEIRSYLANQVDAIKYLRGEMPTPQNMYNLPEKLYGFPLMIEDCVINTGKMTPNDDFSHNAFVLSDGTAVMLGKAGDLTGVEGTTDYTTVQFFMYEEMAAESFTDTENRKIMNRVTEDFDVQVVAPASGFLFTGCV